MVEKASRKILLVDDDPPVLDMLKDIFARDYEILTATGGEEAVRLAKQHGDLATIVMDIKMAGMDGITAARHVREVRPGTPIIFHTGYPGEYDEQMIDEAEKPFDYIQKGKSIPKLIRSVRNAVEAYNLRLNTRRLTHVAESVYGMVGRSSAMQEVFRVIHRVAGSDNKVMILGESGTGKELVARAIHTCSKRAENRFAILNCNHKSSDLVQAELFGSLKGSYTGATVDRIGLFEYADSGTVFLDEIGDLDVDTQIKLLRVLETGEYQKLGSPEIRHSDVRIICATHRDLKGLVDAGVFREDLFFRLKGITITLPPLRRRKEDIPVLVEKFASRFTVERGLPPKIFDTTAVNALIEYEWRGNVRQLLETVESLIVLIDSDIVFGDDVRKYLNAESVTSVEPKALSIRLKEVERTLIVGALTEAGYNISAAAKLLHVDRSNLQKKIKAHNIDMAALRREPSSVGT